jgi:predicted DNA-binding transcriptional regulator YafY
MNFNTAARILRLLNTHPEGALTIGQIIGRWEAAYTGKLPLRNAQRYMSDLSADTADSPAMVELLDDKKEHRYYLRLNQVAHWFMTEEAALQQMLARQVLSSTFQSLATDVQKTQSEFAEKLTKEAAHTKRLRDRLRIVPDGLGRLSARIDSQILAAAIDSIGSNQQLEFEYVNVKGKTSNKKVNPQGLVAKDGTIYLLGVSGLSDAVIHFALHRVISASVLPRPCQARLDFDLDRYIQASHQLSHALSDDGQPIHLQLRVAPETIFHFRERPLNSEQAVDEPDSDDDWFRVSAFLPKTMLLKPFLISLGPGVEVLAPIELREEMSAWVKAMAKHYA